MEIPNAEIGVQKWKIILIELDLILPNKIEEPYLKLGYKAEKLLKAMLNKNKNEQEINELKKVF